ncbi:MAG: hypothetical protein ABA06_04265 [Parcubacteria bacterium C7867-001]|nr:MAG: hypothetical protein ABA06_04265 [Parcubacteria bacterium C7867-001]
MDIFGVHVDLSDPTLPGRIFGACILAVLAFGVIRYGVFGRSENPRMDDGG